MVPSPPPDATTEITNPAQVSAVTQDLNLVNSPFIKMILTSETVKECRCYLIVH